jgi:hypothetical protein
MKNFIAAFLLCCATLQPCTEHTAQAAFSRQTIVTASQVNGTWRTVGGEFKVLALGNQRLRVEFSGTYEYNARDGRMANTGEARGIATIEGDTARFIPDDMEGECVITMRFTRGRLVVRQDGNCAFGANVTAGGTYRRISRRRPVFEEN